MIQAEIFLLFKFWTQYPGSFCASGNVFHDNDDDGAGDVEYADDDDDNDNDDNDDDNDNDNDVNDIEIQKILLRPGSQGDAPAGDERLQLAGWPETLNILF